MHPLLSEAARQERDERPRRAVSPVQVLEDERDGLGLAQAVEQLEQRLEQAQLPDPVAADNRAVPPRAPPSSSDGSSAASCARLPGGERWSGTG